MSSQSEEKPQAVPKIENNDFEAKNNVQNTTTKQKKCDQNHNIQSATQNEVKPRRSERLSKPKLKEPEQLQHCAIRKETPRESGISRKLPSSAKKTAPSKPLSKIIPTKASYTESKDQGNSQVPKPVLPIKKEAPQQVYPRKLGKPATSKPVQSKPLVPHENVMSSTSPPEVSIEMKEEPVVIATGFMKKNTESVQSPDLISESFKKQVQKVTSKQCGIVAMRDDPTLEDDDFMEVIEDPISEERHKQISVPDADEMWQSSDDLSIEIKNEKEDDAQQIESAEVLQKETKPQKEVKKKTIEEIMDEACKPYDPEPPKRYDYRVMFLPSAYTRTLDELSIMKLFGRCLSQNTVVHYDSKGAMLGNGIVRVHRTKEEFAVEHSKDHFWKAKRLVRLPLENPENSELFDMYIYNIPKVDDVTTIINSLKQEYQATEIELFYNPHGFFIGSCRASMTYENAKKLTLHRTYTMKNKSYSVSAFQIEY